MADPFFENCRAIVAKADARREELQAAIVKLHETPSHSSQGVYIPKSAAEHIQRKQQNEKTSKALESLQHEIYLLDKEVEQVRAFVRNTEEHEKERAEIEASLIESTRALNGLFVIGPETFYDGFSGTIDNNC